MKFLCTIDDYMPSTTKNWHFLPELQVLIFPLGFLFLKLWNRTRNSTNQIVHFFKFKNVQPKFQFCFWVQDPVGQVYFCVIYANCVIFCALFALMFAFPFDTCFSFDLCLCPVLMLLLLTLQSPNKWCNFFCYHVSAFFGMLWHPSCAIVCLFACLLFCFSAVYVYLGACLIFCIGFMHCFMHFIVNMITFCIFIFLQVIAGTTWSSLATSDCHNSLLSVFRAFDNPCDI